jgi:SP family general alpha glucoside:H+ symporter-like MFS transporter
MAEDKMDLGHGERDERSANLEDNTKTWLADASVAASNEHALSFREAIKTHRKAVFWCLIVSTSTIMEGYDIVLVQSLFAQPAFARTFGMYTNDGTYQLSGAWQSALGSSPIIGAVFGALANGYLANKFGYRRVLFGALVLITAFIFIIFFATSAGMLVAGLVLCGLPWGIFATMAPAYSSEVCPLALRGYLTVYVNMSWAFGQLMAAGVVEGFVNRSDQWAYRIPFAIQWIWPLPLMIVLWFAPESPWWLIRTGQVDEAEKSLARLSNSTPDDVHRTIAMMSHTNEIEIEAETGTSYWDCFKGIDLRRTEIVCLAYAAQVWCGEPLGGPTAYFFVQAGVSTDNSFKFQVGGLSLAVIGTSISWGLLSRVGRRTLYLWGLVTLALLMLLVGIIAAAAGQGSAASFAQAGCVLAWLFIFYVTVGPVCYAIISEVSATRLRNKSICLGRIAFYISQIIGNVIEPYMVNPTEGNWHGKVGFFWAGTCVLCTVWAYFRLPETKDRSFEEIDLLFANKIVARRFTKMKVDPYALDGEKIKEK